MIPLDYRESAQGSHLSLSEISWALEVLVPYLSLLFYLNLQSWAHGIEKEYPKRNKVAERGHYGVMVPNLQQGRKENSP